MEETQRAKLHSYSIEIIKLILQELIERTL